MKQKTRQKLTANSELCLYPWQCRVDFLKLSKLFFSIPNIKKSQINSKFLDALHHSQIQGVQLCSWLSAGYPAVY